MLLVEMYDYQRYSPMRPILQIVIDMFFLAIISSSLRLEKNPSRA